MNARLVRFLLHVYPPQWRAEYGLEMEDLLRQREMNAAELLNVLWGAIGERARQPLARVIFLLLSGSLVAFISSLLLAPSIWSALSAQAAKQYTLVQNTPFEVFTVVWLAVPSLAGTFLTFAWMLVLIAIFARRQPEVQMRRFFFQFVLWAGSVFVLSTVASVFLWQHRLAEELGQPLVLQRESLMSVWQYFELFASSTMSVILCLQVPILLIFGVRLQAIRLKSSAI